ncbi:MAG: hypothetical protein IJP45_03890 [Paludibacteraceae bacterium]|nr:hypothetical protein [Paludibacteraceae bacterium]MBQ6764312.1 hypothetical protein [Paludibacteraceae bacterium]MBR0064350.1 hypothetical protein [Paludibacteraceae bacterium]
MKKIFILMAAMVCAAGMFAQSYGILVNGKVYFQGTKVDEFEGFQQYLAHVQVANGDQLQLCDADNRAVWAVDLNPASVEGFTRDGDHYNVTVSGCYDFYIKLKYEQDELYIGPGSDCGEGIDISGQGGQGGTDPADDDVNYYAMGWINAADAGETAYDTYDENLLFKDGKLTIDCKYGSYIGIKDHNCNYYYSKTATTIADTKVTLEWANGWSPCEKWAIPEGVNYIIMRSASYKGTIVLERVDKATYDAYHLGGNQAIENTGVSEKAHKMIIDGQLRIVRGNRMFDATGREL